MTEPGLAWLMELVEREHRSSLFRVIGDGNIDEIAREIVRRWDEAPALRKDKERLDFLLKLLNDDAEFYHGTDLLDIPGNSPVEIPLSRQEIDEAIDAAMAGGEDD